MYNRYLQNGFGGSMPENNENEIQNTNETNNENLNNKNADDGTINIKITQKDLIKYQFIAIAILILGLISIPIVNGIKDTIELKQTNAQERVAKHHKYLTKKQLRQIRRAEKKRIKRIKKAQKLKKKQIKRAQKQQRKQIKKQQKLQKKQARQLRRQQKKQARAARKAAKKKNK